MKKLTGTEKQIAWAEDIRNSYINQLKSETDFSNSDFALFSFYVKECKEIISELIDTYDEEEKTLIRQVFPIRWRREVSAIEDLIKETITSDDESLKSTLIEKTNVLIEYKLNTKVEAKYWIENYKHLAK